jgi:nitrite reductase (NADH) small subunit
MPSRHEAPDLDWISVCALAAIPVRGARTIETVRGTIALFRTGDGAVYALDDRCPHRGGPLSQGLVFDHKVACPLHHQVFALDTGAAVAPDPGCVRTYPVRVAGDQVFVQLS